MYFTLNLYNKLRVKYIIYRTVRILVLIEFVNQFSMHRMNSMKVPLTYLPKFGVSYYIIFIFTEIIIDSRVLGT
jgi:hypothetical protein